MEEFNVMILQEAAKCLSDDIQEEYQDALNSLLDQRLDFNAFDDQVIALIKRSLTTFDKKMTFISYLYNATHDQGCMIS